MGESANQAVTEVILAGALLQSNQELRKKTKLFCPTTTQPIYCHYAWRDVPAYIMSKSFRALKNGGNPPKMTWEHALPLSPTVTFYCLCTCHSFDLLHRDANAADVLEAPAVIPFLPTTRRVITFTCSMNDHALSSQASMSGSEPEKEALGCDTPAPRFSHIGHSVVQELVVMILMVIKPFYWFLLLLRQTAPEVADFESSAGVFLLLNYF